MNEGYRKEPAKQSASPSRMSCAEYEEESGILFGHLCLATEAQMQSASLVTGLTA